MQATQQHWVMKPSAVRHCHRPFPDQSFFENTPTKMFIDTWITCFQLEAWKHMPHWKGGKPDGVGMMVPRGRTACPLTWSITSLLLEHLERVSLSITIMHPEKKHGYINYPDDGFPIGWRPTEATAILFWIGRFMPSCHMSTNNRPADTSATKHTIKTKKTN